MKYWIIFIILVLSVVISGCSTQNPANSNEPNATNAMTIPDKSDSETLTESPQASNINDYGKENTVDITNDVESKKSDYEKLSREEKEQYDIIQGAIKSNEQYTIEFSSTEPQKGEIKYDFNNDGKIETLEYSTIVGTDDNGYEIVKKCELSSGENKTEYESLESHLAEGIYSIGIIDIDKNDNYIEFYLKDGNLYCTTVIYRLIDNAIKNIASIDNDILATSGDGKIYYWGGNLFEPSPLQRLNTDLVLEYYDINKNDIVQTSQIVGKTITAPFQFILYKSADDVIDGAPATLDDEIAMSKGKIIKIVQEGEKFQVLSIDEGIKIRTEDGKEGWIGGFHMIWD